jgi:hypothetical protein
MVARLLIAVVVLSPGLALGKGRHASAGCSNKGLGGATPHSARRAGAPYTPPERWDTPVDQLPDWSQQPDWDQREQGAPTKAHR